MNTKPVTPFLDAVRQEAEQVAQWEAEEARKEAQQRAEAPARERARAERDRVARERREACEAAAHDAEQAVKALADALTRYRANIPVPPHAVAGRLRIFLGNALGRFGPMESNMSIPAPLLYELFKEVK